MSARPEPAAIAPETAAALARLRAVLATRRPATGAPTGHPARPAAVLVLVRAGAEGLSLVFTLRPADLPSHAGQISFPGGNRHGDDESPTACALRETTEEIGVDASQVEVLGRLDDVVTPTGYVIAPVVGIIRGAVDYHPRPREVAEVFEVPLVVLRHPACRRDGGRVAFGGVDYQLYEYHCGGRVIWGATGRMVHQLLVLWPE